MGRSGFVVQRLLLLIPVAVGVTIIVFFMVHLIPGDPAATILGIHATPKAVALLHQQWGLNRPLASQYWLFLDRLLHGNLGQSIYYGGSVSSLILSHLPPTLWLLTYATVLTVLISVPLAVLAATRRDGIRDHVVRAVPLVGLGMPQFWLGFLLIYVFAISLRIFPVSGYGTGFTGHLQSMFLPSLTVALALTPVVIRSLRASMLNVLTAEYIVTARSKGVSSRRLFQRHVLRNAVIPAVTVLAINIGFLVGATVIIEQIFAIPGIGQLMINSIFQRDFSVVQGVTLVFGVLVVLVNLLADLSYAALDPRVRFDR
jgi:peptide/nickel transport system permease protein